MFQPEAKYEFIRRYCSPGHGWQVFVDIDASELGETGGKRKKPESIERQRLMQEQGRQAMQQLTSLGATVRGSRSAWFGALKRAHPSCGGLSVPGDRDIIALHPADNRLLVAEVEGTSSGQPETKLYKALGQIVMAISETESADFDTSFVVVVHGEKIGAHLRRASALSQLGISGLQIEQHPSRDRWVIGTPL